AGRWEGPHHSHDPGLAPGRDVRRPVSVQGRRRGRLSQRNAALPRQGLGFRGDGQRHGVPFDAVFGSHRSPVSGGRNGLSDPVAPKPDRFAVRLRGFGPVGILAMVVVVGLGPILEPLGALLALLWAHLSRTPWSELGLVRPKRWVGTVALG